jgi:hypothetical protein
VNVTRALFDVLAADAELAGLLSTYEGEPAIFSADPVPQDATRPFLVISGSDTDDDFGAKNEVGRSVVRSLRVYGDADEGTIKPVDDIAERVRSLFHRNPFPVTGTIVYMVDAQGPLDAPAGPDLYGRRVVLRFHTGHPTVAD